MSNSYGGSLSADFDVSCAAHNEPDYCPVQCTVKHTFLHFHFLDETLGEDRPRLVRQSSDLRDARDLKSRRHIETLVPLTRHTAMHSCAYSDAKGNFSSGWEFGQKSLIVLRPSTPNAFEGDEEPSPAHINANESIGSAGHKTRTCRPCAWWWKPGGCSRGRTCEYCHLCDEFTLPARMAQRKKQQRIISRAKNPHPSRAFARASFA